MTNATSDTTDDTPRRTFRDLGLSETFTRPLAADGIEEPFEIQALSIPLALSRNDLIGQARTGSGKTLAFGLPALHHVDPTYKEAQGLIVTPTRELCLQIVDDLTKASRESDVTITAVYGGVPIEPQAKALTGGAHIVVGTPGRLLDHLGRGNLDLSTIKTLILDEADEMLDMGFLPDVERLIRACPESRQTLLFSATMRSEIVELARRYLNKPTFLRAQDQELSMPSGIEHHFFITHKLDKPRVLARILQQPGRGLAVVFTRTKFMADRLVQELDDLGVDATAIHGDLRQQTRERNLGKFRDNKVDVLVATEVAARGLDIDGMTHVVNYDVPDDEKMYIHRVGRTARAGEEGVAITFATHAEVDRLNVVRKALELEEHTFGEVFSTSPELTERFDLPAETPWDQFSKARRSGGSSNGGTSAKGDTRTASSRARSSKNSSSERPSSSRSKRDGDEDERSSKSGARGSRSRAKTGSKGRGKGEDAEPKADAPAARADVQPGLDAGDDADVVRTRKRTRVAPEDGATKTEGESSRSRSSKGSSSDGDESGSRGSSRSRSNSKRGSSDKDRSSRPNRGNSGRDSKSGASGRKEPVTHQPRGEGQPRHARPLKVEHLP